jgi:murein DD-endopeptidase MepM/ murein hydrolase activator NlpD
LRYSEKKRRSKKERVGFYTALSICIVAVGMAAYSTYTSLSGVFGDNESESLAVNNIVTGVEETEKKTSAPTETVEKPTETEMKSTETEFIETEPKQTKTALQTMTSVKTSLSYPLDKRKVIKEYSEESVYNKTLNQWQAHTGVDFACDKGDNVYSMGDGEVRRIYNDDLLGKTIVVESSDYTAYYSGMSGNVKVEKGSTVKEGDVLGTAGTVPCEELEENHIHIAVKVNGQFTDVLSLINNDE